MGSFGQAIPVTGPNTLEPKEQVWFSEVRIFKSTKNGDVTYHAHFPHPNNGDEIDQAVRAALQAAAQQLTAKASHKGRT